MASGSQVCNPICADFPIDPMKKQQQITSITFNLKLMNEKVVSCK